MRYFSKESVLVVALLLVVAASGFDLYFDFTHGALLSHIAKEALIMLLASILIIWSFIEHQQQAVEIGRLKQELERGRLPQAAMSEEMKKARRQLSELVSQQFTAWQLTTSEKEVGWLLLKGLSLKEISVLRDTVEKTVRQQASSIYRKAGISGRHAFSAWFIEDLL